MTGGVQSVTTARLSLRPISASDLSALFPIFNDAEGWWYDPQGRHVDQARSAAWIDTAAQRWSTDGLSYWTARSAETGDVIGVGGVQRHASGCWNLFYRLATSSWGRGLATELATASLSAAHVHDERAPVIAWIAEHNQPSRRVAERIGLQSCGLRVDTTDGQLRLAYADRHLPEM